MNSFNVYGQTTETIGGNTPVWLGTVKPIPVGATINSTERYAGRVISAGTAVLYDAASRTLSIVEDEDAAAASNANGYMYNDLYIDESMTGATATAAIVMHHPEGLLIERVYPDITEEQIAQLQSQIPGVLLVRG